ncbi:hypothetical protein GCM10023149_20850 [Mucilaginibacter gynuensis]|uniref:Uncharacterized protein n=2 Tax=Mucilaginibacter gynuensis TaxID=1302236 RepID=A0ABP8GBA5_9SPHI
MGIANGTAFMAACGCIGGTTGIPNCSVTPCSEKLRITGINSQPNINGQNVSILAATVNSNPPKEWGADRKLTTPTSGVYKPEIVRQGTASNIFPSNFTWDAVNGYSIGISHGHPAGFAPSPADAVWAYGNLSNSQLVAAGAADIARYKGQVSVTTTTANGTYIITVKDWTALATLYTNYLANPSAKDQEYIDAGLAYKKAHPEASYETSSEYALASLYGSAVNIYKAPVNSSNYVPIGIDSSGHISVVPCP